VIGSATRVNATNRDMTRAISLAQEIRELLATLPTVEDGGGFGPEAGETSLAHYDDADDFDALTFTPPINAQRQTLSGGEWAGWTQAVTVQNVDPNYLAGQAVPDGSTDMIRVNVTIRRGNQVMHQMSWVVAAFAEQDGG